MDPGRVQLPPGHPTANQKLQTGKTMSIQITMGMYTARRAIAGKHVKTDPGKKAMSLQPGLPQLQTGAAGAHHRPQPGPRRRLQLQPLQHAAVLPAVLPREVPTTGVV